MSFRKVMYGTAIMSLVRILRLVGQFVAVPILSRLLSPAEYGLVAIAMPFALFAMMLADAGIGMSLVRTPPGDRVAWSTSFWLTIALGLILGAIMAALSPLAAYIFHEPSLQPMILVLAFIVVAQTIHLIPVAALQQAQRFNSIAVADVASTVVGIATAIYMAYHNYGAWALIGQQVAFFAVRMVLMLTLSPFRPKRVFDWHAVREHVLFGRNVLGTSLVNYANRSADNWIVGKLLGTSLLGFYSMAFQFARMPAMTVSGPLQYVLYSQLAKLNGDKAAITRIYLLVTRLLAALIIPLMGMIAVAHAPIFSLMLSSKWTDAGTVFMLLAPGCAIQAITCITEAVIYALGRSDLQLRAVTRYTLLWLPCLGVAAFYGITPAAITFSVTTILYQLYYIGLVLKLLGESKHDYFETYLIPLIATGLGICAYQVVGSGEAMADWMQVMLAGVIGLAVLLFTLLIQKRSLIDQLRNWNMAHEQNLEPPVAAAVDAAIE